MSDPTDPKNTDPKNNVRILPPDQTLRKKIGNVDLDKVLSPQAIQAAQEVIANAGNEFLTESMNNLIRLEEAAQFLTALPEEAHKALNDIVTYSFAIKSNAGLAGYELASGIAKSLHLRCEVLTNTKLTPTDMSIIKWHIDSLKQILTSKVKGSGGPVGEAIRAELAKLEASSG